MFNHIICTEKNTNRNGMIKWTETAYDDERHWILKQNRHMVDSDGRCRGGTCDGE
ncbi:hypothetical protein BDV93DRAFT_519370 [Ceratobasidium sp. AG-I]|nr:hypothetical protein BDV93DRAFT_519370 [Ceratobasidium sp. AG-I]